MSATRVQAGIIGAGPAGLFLSHLLHLSGIESIVLESRSRDHVEHRVRAGVLEQGTVDLMRDVGLSERMDREGLVHTGIELRFAGRSHRIAMADLAGGRSITIYGQQEVVKDLIAIRLAAGADIRFEVEDVQVHAIDGDHPSITFREDGREERLECDFIVGCDGFHGVARRSVPDGVLTEYHHEFPFAWLGILVAAPPSTDELIYARHDLGFALHSMRSPSIGRLYIQVDPTAQIEDWPDARIWEQLHLRLAYDGWSLEEGPVIEKGIAQMRSFVVEPMQYGRLFLAGDAAHIVPATGAKGLNLAVHDVFVLSRALAEWYATGSGDQLDDYSATCLRRVWRAQDFSNYMSSMLHRYPGDDPFRDRLQLARLETLTVSTGAAQALAVNYTGLPLV